MATTRWFVSCQALCQQLFLPTHAFKATDFVNFIALPDLLLAAAAAAAPDGRGHLRRGIGNALDALACGPARPAKFCNLKARAPTAQAKALNDRFWSRRGLNKRV
eukprot:365267-Chlamydomonas_euryale.AAC.3